MAVYAIGTTTLLYWVKCISCAKDKDYPHELK